MPNFKLIAKTGEIKGKQIKKVAVEGARIGLAFDDNSYCCIRAVRLEEGDTGIMLEWDSSEIGDYILNILGVLSDEAYKQIKEHRESEIKKTREAIERRELNRLKAKFE